MLWPTPSLLPWSMGRSSKQAIGITANLIALQGEKISTATSCLIQLEQGARANTRLVLEVQKLEFRVYLDLGFRKSHVKKPC